MKRIRLHAAFFVLIFSMCMGLFAQTETRTALTRLDEARNLVLQGRQQQAVAILRDILVDPQASAYYPDAQFLLGKSLMAQGKLDEASKAFESLINSWPNHPNAEECHYQRGRIFYLQGEYQNSIQALSRFMEKYPQSFLISNAVYWTAEALYASAYLDESKKMFGVLVQKYPDNNRVESARYKISLIDLKKREQQLLELLKWSHQENIRNMEDYQAREKTFEDAIRSYQKRLYSLASEDFKQELINLQSQIESLKTEQETDASTINQLTARLKSVQEQLTAANIQLDEAKEKESALRKDLNRPLSDALAELERQKALLDAREAALNLKEKALEKAAE